MRSFLLAALALACLAHPAAAAPIFTITVGDAKVPPGQTGYVDVFIRAGTANTPLNSFAFDLLIAPVAPASAGQLQFVTPTSNPYALFGAQSAYMQDFAPTPYPVNSTNDGIFLFDFTSDDGFTSNGQNVLIGTTDTLLARVPVSLGASAAHGTQFTVTPVFDLADFSYYTTPGDVSSQLSYTFPSEGDLVGVAGTVTAVPEPASLALFAAVALGGAAYAIRRRAPAA